MVSQIRAEKHIDRQRGITMRKNSVRGAIRKSSRRNSDASRRNSLMDQAKEGRSDSVNGKGCLNEYIYIVMLV